MNFKFERLIWQKPSDRSFHRPLLDYGDRVDAQTPQRLIENWLNGISYKPDTILSFLSILSVALYTSLRKEKIFICSVGKILGIFFLSLCPMQQRWRNNGRRCIFHSISTARRRQSLPEITLTLDLKPRRDDNPLTRSVRTVCDQLYRVDRCTLVSVYAQ